MENYHYLHLSNRTEKLYQELKERLFASSHPFTKRIIIVPSAAMKSWLMLQMAADPEIGISAGIEVSFIDPTLNNLYKTLSRQSPQDVDPYEPSELELALALEEAITNVAVSYGTSGSLLQKEWLPLVQYLGVKKSEGKKLSKQIHKRIMALASMQAKLFGEYGVSGGEMVAGWVQGNPAWQGLLWKQMEIVFSAWNYPAKKLAAFDIDTTVDPRDIQVHLFGLSFLAPLHHRFLQKIAAHVPVYYYLLSPCKKFWGDTLSDKESLRLKNFWKKQGANEGSQEVLEDYLRDRNPLLANFGRLGREMTQLTESMDSHSVESYVLPEAVMQNPSYSELESAEDLVLEESSSPLTLLQAVQADMALLRNPAADQKIAFEGYDGSIQVHAAPKKSREVQVVYDTLVSILDRHAKDDNPILPGDIFVMAPNLAEYVPFIRNVFESPESLLDIQLMDLQVPSQSLLIQGFLHLLSLSHGRWEASALLQLFDYAAFRARYRLSGEDVLDITKWVKEAGINWGRDDHHRQEIFERDHHNRNLNEESFIGTWEHGLGRLLEGLAMSSEESDGDYIPLDTIETSQGDLLGTVVHVLRSLQEDLKILRDGTEMTLEEWSTYLACMFDAYFLPSGEDEDVEGHRILKMHMESFAKASKRLGQSKFQFKTILRHLDSQLKRETTTYKESNLNSVRFSTLLPMRAVPAKVIVLMGMGDGVFPRTDQTNTLNMLQENIADYSPSQVDFDRYIFLESILSARQYFILSYESQEPGNAALQSPSLLVKELTAYLDEAYAISYDGVMGNVSGHCTYNHSLLPFHQSYFMESSRFKSHSHSNYLAALSHYGLEKTPRRAFIGEFKPDEIAKGVELQKPIDLKELVSYAKSPLKVYVNQQFGIYIDQEKDRVIKDEEDIFLSKLDEAILSRRGLFGSSSATISQAERSGQIPHGPFKEVALKDIKKQVEQYVGNLKSLDIDARKVFTIELREHFTKPELTEEGWKVPAIALHIEGIGNVKLVGTLENVCEKGLIILNKAKEKKDRDKAVLEQRPSLLVLRWVIARYNLPIAPQVNFIKCDKLEVKAFKSEVELPSHESLVSYVGHYLSTKSAPTPLVPDLIPSILAGKMDELQNVFKDDANDPFSRNFDQYMTWFGRNSPKSTLESSGSYWQEKAQALFVDLFEEKQSKKSSSAKEEL